MEVFGFTGQTVYICKVVMKKNVIISVVCLWNANNE